MARRLSTPRRLGRQFLFGLTRAHQLSHVASMAGSWTLIPAFESDADLTSVANRLRWYLGPALEGGLTVYAKFAGAQPETTDFPFLKLNIEPSSDYSLALAWRTKPSLAAEIIRRRGRVRIIDPGFWSTAEANTHLRLVFHDVWAEPERSALRDQGAKMLGKLRADVETGMRCYVFGTGPSLEQAKKHSFDDGIRIVCNSIVRSKQLLDHIAPHVVVATDPVFHFGSSEYASHFRSDLRNALDRTEAVAVVPLEYAPPLLAEMPQHSDRIIPIEQRRARPFHFPTPSEPWTIATGNVLTGFMLPLAAALSPARIDILGCDGRDPRDIGFWKHLEQAQYDTLYQTVVESHPSFFRDRNYAGYYEDHVSTLEALIRELERLRIEVVGSTPSMIPALEKRYEPL
jgi:hypothetical protein